MRINPKRRQVLRSAGVALAAIPLLVVGRPAAAGTNAALREKLQYQGQPKDGQSCASCLEFIPGKTDEAPGGCKQIPGDDQISPEGYCILWNTM